MASTHALAGCQACIFALNCLVEGKSHTLNAKANAICISSNCGTGWQLYSTCIVVSSCWNAFGLTVDKRLEYWAHSRHTHTWRQRNLQWLQKPRRISFPSLSQLECSSAGWWLSVVCVGFILFLFLPNSIRDLSRTCCWRLCIIYDPFCNCPILYVCTLQRFNDSPGL